MMAEESPDYLMELYKVPTLEKAFLNLCLEQE